MRISREEQAKRKKRSKQRMKNEFQKIERNLFMEKLSYLLNSEWSKNEYSKCFKSQITYTLEQKEKGIKIIMVQEKSTGHWIVTVESEKTLEYEYFEGIFLRKCQKLTLTMHKIG